MNPEKPTSERSTTSINERRRARRVRRFSYGALGLGLLGALGLGLIAFSETNKRSTRIAQIAELEDEWIASKQYGDALESALAKERIAKEAALAESSARGAEMEALNAEMQSAIEESQAAVASFMDGQEKRDELNALIADLKDDNEALRENVLELEGEIFRLQENLGNLGLSGAD